MADLAVTGKTTRTTWVTVKLNARRSDRIRIPISSTDRAGLELRGFRPGLTKRRLFPESGGRVGRCRGDGGEPRLPALRAQQESYQKKRKNRAEDYVRFDNLKARDDMIPYHINHSWNLGGTILLLIARSHSTTWHA